MDSILRDSLSKIEEHLPCLTSNRQVFFGLKAHEKVSFSRLFLKSNERTVDAKNASVWASEEWKEYAEKLAKAECDYMDSMAKHRLLEKAHDSEYITYKMEQGIINRQ